RVVVHRVLNELEARQSHGVERLVVGAAGIANGDDTGGEIFDGGEPLFEDGPHHLVALQINAANSAGAVIDIEIAGEAVVFAGGLHGGGIGEMLLDVSGGAQEAFFFAAPQGHANRSVHLQVARLQDAHHFHGDGAAGSVIGGAGAHVPGVEVAAHHHQL